MKAIIIEEFGGVDTLKYIDKKRPIIASNEVLIETKSIGINPIDIKIRKGERPVFANALPFVLGRDIAGIVCEVGADVKDFKLGDRVFGMLNFPANGTYATHVKTTTEEIQTIPENVSFEEAAGASLAALTALQALRNFYTIKKQDRVLIHAAAGGAGHIAVQLARYYGAYVIATASKSNHTFLKDLGADELIDYKENKFEHVISNIDFVFDGIGGEYIQRSLKTMKPNATIVSLPSILNDSVVDAAEKDGKKGFKHLVTNNADDLLFIRDLMANKVLKIHVSKVYAFEDMKEAHLKIETGSTRGKIVINI